MHSLQNFFRERLILFSLLILLSSFLFVVKPVNAESCEPHSENHNCKWQNEDCSWGYAGAGTQCTSGPNVCNGCATENLVETCDGSGNCGSGYMDPHNPIGCVGTPSCPADTPGPPTPTPCVASSCSAVEPACGQKTRGTDNCGNPCEKQGGACGCVPDGSCDAPNPSCDQTTFGNDNCGGTCQKTGSACGPGPTDTPVPQPTPTPTITPTPSPIQPTQIITMPPTPPKSAAAASTTAQRWVCLQSEPCAPGGVRNPNCSGRGSLDHRARLTTKPTALVINSTPTYVFECIQTPSGQICTTGNSSIDDQLVGRFDTLRSNLDYLNANYGYVFAGFFKADGVTASIRPEKSSGGGIVGPYEWESRTPPPTSLNRIFLAMNQYTDQGVTGSEGGQQQGSFIPQPSDKKCVMIKWDPYGKILDKLTNRPLKDTQVLLYMKNNDNNFKLVTAEDILGGIKNPIITGADGVFDFKVPDGVYKIEVKASNYNPYQSEEIVLQGRGQELTILLEPLQKEDSSNFLKELLTSLIEGIKNFVK